MKNPVDFDKIEYKIVPICIPIDSHRFQEKDVYSTGWGLIFDFIYIYEKIFLLKLFNYFLI